MSERARNLQSELCSSPVSPLGVVSVGERSFSHPYFEFLYFYVRYLCAIWEVDDLMRGPGNCIYYDLARRRPYELIID